MAKTRQKSKPAEASDGKTLREMMAGSMAWLEKSAADVDAINVFPVPDGDTGTNMLLTLRSAVEEAEKVPGEDAAVVAAALAHGALMGARGNSGIILSQVFKGIARGLKGQGEFGPEKLATAFRMAADDAYKGLARPVEGTMLTVMRDVADAARKEASRPDASIVSTMQAAVNTARESVARTPTLLPALREAGVVDAGGQGLFVILEGALHSLKGEAEQLRYRKPTLIASAMPAASRAATLAPEKEDGYGYCTEFMLEGSKLKPQKMKAQLAKKGQSLVLVGDDRTVRVHIHTPDPGWVLHYAVARGTLSHIKIENMDEQHKDFLAMQKERGIASDIAVVAVAPGDGFSEVMRSLGVSVVVPGGQTMNPSVRDILKAVEGAPADKVIILPNNKNVVHATRQVPRLTSKKVAVVPTETLPQGIASLLAFNFESGLEQNARNMEEASRGVKTVEVTRAVRSTKVRGLKIGKGQAIGIVDGELVAAGDGVAEALRESLERAGIGSAELATIYYGADVTEEKAQKAMQELRSAYPGVQFEVVKGGQPHYQYIASVE